MCFFGCSVVGVGRARFVWSIGVGFGDVVVGFSVCPFPFCLLFGLVGCFWVVGLVFYLRYFFVFWFPLVCGDGRGFISTPLTIFFFFPVIVLCIPPGQQL